MSEHNDLPERANMAMMARRLGMSRTRLYQLLGKTFPSPTLDPDARPYFTREQQKQILAIYHSNVGLDGRSVFFRPRGERTPKPSVPQSKKSKPAKATSTTDADLVLLLTRIRGLGLTHVTKGSLRACVAELFPTGVPADQNTVVRAVFVHLHDKNSGEKQGR